jgi:hypothetical protein
MLQATLSALEKELNDYQVRVEFLQKYLDKIDESYGGKDTLEAFKAINEAYEYQKEIDFKKSLIIQREAQIKQAKEQAKLKEQAVQEFPDVLDKAKEAYNTMLDDLEEVNKQKKSKEQANFKKGLEGQIDQVDTMLEGIEKRFYDNSDHKQVLNDFRQLHEIIKLIN